MSGESDLNVLLRDASPCLDPGVYVFVSLPGVEKPPAGLLPVATVQEQEGLTLVLDEATAVDRGLSFEVRLVRISLRVHSSLTAVGLTAAFSAQLASAGISANVVAGFYHDHIFVPLEKQEEAMKVLNNLGSLS